MTHIEAMEEHTCDCERQLWKLEQDSGLYDEVDSFCSAIVLFCDGKPKLS